MKSSTFIDTGYVLALVNLRDPFHARALAASSRITQPYVTTEAVLTEIANSLSRQKWRTLAVATL